MSDEMSMDVPVEVLVRKYNALEKTYSELANRYRAQEHRLKMTEVFLSEDGSKGVSLADSLSKRIIELEEALAAREEQLRSTTARCDELVQELAARNAEVEQGHFQTGHVGEFLLERLGEAEKALRDAEQTIQNSAWLYWNFVLSHTNRERAGR